MQYDTKTRQKESGKATLQIYVTTTLSPEEPCEFSLEKGSKIHFRQREEHMLFYSFEFKSYHIRNAFPDYNTNFMET